MVETFCLLIVSEVIFMSLGGAIDEGVVVDEDRYLGAR